MSTDLQQRVESLSAADRVIQTLLRHSDHGWHGRPGIIIPDARAVIGVKWFPVTHKVENDEKVVYRLDKKARGGSDRVRLGVMGEDGQVRDGGRVVGEYRKPGIFPEVVAYYYSQAAEIWSGDNEFAARWASYAFKQDNRDLKVILAALMLVQDRFGEGVLEDGEIVFYDEDFREVGEAMCLDYKKANRLNPKQLLRVFEVLEVPAIAEINRKLGFGKSTRRPPMGRLVKTVYKWLRYRETNGPLFDGLLSAGFGKAVIALCQRVGYKPLTGEFFIKLRWKQKQSKDGRRAIRVGEDVEAAESWDDLDEAGICGKIIEGKLNYKRVVGMLPSSIGLTRAIMAACIEAKGLSDADLIILTPTLEDLGLLEVTSVKKRWQAATKRATDQRSLHIAQRVKKAETVEVLEQASASAGSAKIKEAIKGLTVKVVVDKSGSMEGAIERAKSYLVRLLPAFEKTPDKLHVSIFNGQGQELKLKSLTPAGVGQAFRGHRAEGVTDYGRGVMALAHHKPADDEECLMIFVGDQKAHTFSRAVLASGLRPAAFGMIHVDSRMLGGGTLCVEKTAVDLGIPCFRIEEETFDDVNSPLDILRDLMASTPVSAAVAAQPVQRRTSLVETILKTDLLKKPIWASSLSA